MQGSKLSRLMQLRDERDKFTKAQAYYGDDSIFGHPYVCANCVHYNADKAKCTLVSEQGKPGEGYIDANGVCTLFNSGTGRIRALQLLWGRADREGLAPERVRATSFMFTYSFLDLEPPEDLKEKSFIDFDTVQGVVKGRFAKTVKELKE